MTQEHPVLTAAQVANRLQVSQETVREWARTGQVRAIILPGGHYRFPVDVIEAIERGDLEAASAA